MPASNYNFVAWEEHIVCPERGRRVVHFYLRNAEGHLVLAVIGTEKSIRHMLYVVTGQFSVTYGAPSMKWRSRREVVEWLQSLISKPSSDLLQVDDSVQEFGATDMSTITGSLGHLTYLLDQMVPRKLKVHDSNIVWSGEAWICTKQLKHYPAFLKNGASISVLSFVFILGEEQNQYVGYLEDMYENKKGKKKVKVRWFYHHQEVKSVIPQLNLNPVEVLITPHVQVVSAECIVGPATVLTPAHYEKYLTLFSQTLSSGVHMCCSQYKNNKFKRFTLTKLRGYCNQAILSSLDGPFVSDQKVTCQMQERPGPVPGNQVMKSQPIRLKLKLKLSGTGVTTQPQLPPSFKVDEKIEFLCEDSGIRGCWFRCKVLKSSQNKLRIQYDDLEDADGTGKLEECVRAMKVAEPDKLGMRCPDRLTIRPRPPKVSTDCKFEIGAAIDVWWCDGWWEGVVLEIGISNNDDMKVYLPGEDRYLTIHKENARISRDWICNKWVDIKGKPDILSYLSANLNPGMKLPPNSIPADASGSVSSPPPETSVIAASTLEAVKEVERDLPQPAPSNDQKDANEMNPRKRPRNNEESEVDNDCKEHESVDVSKKSVLVSDGKQ